ncbi:MAG: NAD(P)H-hydrate dehydratase [Thermoprotei archaeon]|nr:NAD(P)H-hydrate dehydratase [Thermoprotei archaeon]
MACPGIRDARPEEAVSVEDVRAFEVNSVWWGVSLGKLMENAGRAVADSIECIKGGVRGFKVAVLAGRGGNGGDGLVAGRHLASRGSIVEVHLLYDPQLVTHPDTRDNLRYILDSRRIKTLTPGSRGWLEISDADIVIDAVLGVGVKGPLRSPVKDAMKAFNDSGGLRVSIDIPTGLDPDTGIPAEGAARADVTVTMHRPKRGLFANQGPLHSGRVLVADIGIPLEAEEYAGPGDVSSRIPVRPPPAYKGMGGRVMVIGGSQYYVGAPIIAAKAASASGADLVYLASPHHIAFPASVENPYIIPVVRGGPEEFEAALASFANRVHAIIFGPGLGVTEEARVLLEMLLEHAKGKSIVIDADGLKVLRDINVRLWREVVLTPHRGEAGMLLGETVDPLKADPTSLARRVSERYGSTVIVKAPVDAICEPGGACRLNKTGHPAMAVGGTGDALTGIIASFIARRVALGYTVDTLNTVAAAAYVCGRSGELAVEEKGETINPLDVVDKIPAAIREARALAGER